MVRPGLLALVLGCLLGTAARQQSLEDVLGKWDEYKNKYGKQYSDSEEENKHKKSFAKNILRIDTHNKWATKKSKQTFEIDVNHLADRLSEQQHDTTQFDYLLKRQQSATAIHSSSTASPLPDHFDWREKKVITRVKDQGRFCRSSYAFAAIGAVESLHARLNGTLLELSEQNIVDCTVGPKGCYDMVPRQKICNQGCKNGNHISVFEYIMEKKGIDDESSYPYVGEDQKCRFNASVVGATVKDYYFLGNIPADYEKELKDAVATKGPVAVVFDGRFPFDFYKKGVYNGCPAHPKKPHFSHFGLVVGYGTDKELGDYWSVKMSYGPDWGEAGYIRMARNKNNNCGISTFAIYPI